MPAVNDIYKVRIVYYAASLSKVCYNVTHWRVLTVSGTGQTDAQSAASFSAYFTNALKAIISDLAEYRGVGLQRLFPTPTGVEILDAVGMAPGQQTGDPMSTQTAGLFKLYTAKAGRAFRGRVYVPFPGELRNNSGGHPDGTYLANLASLAILFAPVAFGAGPNLVGWEPVIYHKATNTGDAVIGQQLRSEWATQRRRGLLGKKLLPPV